MNHIDMHIHTTASDGSDTVSELLKKIQDSGITTFSVSDHDTIDGALEMDRLVPANLKYIRGIEFSCVTPCGKCHILGYNYDPACTDFQDVLDYGKALRRKKLDQRLAGMDQKFGIRLTDEEMAWLLSQKSPGRPHLGRILVERGMFPDVNAAITKLINQCKAPNSRVPAEMVIPAILSAGGIPVWAHPLGGEGEQPLTEEEFSAQLNYLKSIGIQGLECFYSRYTSEQVQFLRSQADKHALLVSAGSDYHGKNKANITLGKLNASDLTVPKEQITLLSAL